MCFEALPGQEIAKTASEVKRAAQEKEDQEDKEDKEDKYEYDEGTSMMSEHFTRLSSGLIGRTHILGAIATDRHGLVCS